MIRCDDNGRVMLRGITPQLMAECSQVLMAVFRAFQKNAPGALEHMAMIVATTIDRAGITAEEMWKAIEKCQAVREMMDESSASR